MTTAKSLLWVYPLHTRPPAPLPTSSRSDQIKNLNPRCISIASRTVVLSRFAARSRLSPCSPNAFSPSARRLFAETRIWRNHRLSCAFSSHSIRWQGAYQDSRGEHRQDDAVRLGIAPRHVSTVLDRSNVIRRDHCRVQSQRRRDGVHSRSIFGRPDVLQSAQHAHPEQITHTTGDITRLRQGVLRVSNYSATGARHTP